MSHSPLSSADVLLGATAPSIEIVALLVTAIPVSLFLIVLLLALRHAARGMQAKTSSRASASRKHAPFGVSAPRAMGSVAPRRSQLRAA